MSTAVSFPLRHGRLFLAGLVLAVASTVALTAFAQPGGFGHHHHGASAGFGAGGPMMFGGRGLERMLDSVNATEQQRTQIRQITQAAMADVKAQREAGRALREQAATLFAQPTVDAAAAERLRQQMLQQHDQVSRRMTQAMLDVSRVLTPEQRKQLVERMQQRRELMQRHHREREALDGQRR